MQRGALRSSCSGRYNSDQTSDTRFFLAATNSSNHLAPLTTKESLAMAPKKPPVSQKKTAASPRQQPQPPDWPPFKPLSLASDLSLSTVVDFQIIVVKNFWTKSLCKNYVSFLKGLPLTTTPGVPKKGEALRVNDRYRVIDEGFANRLWAETGLKELVCGIDIWGGEPIGLNPAIRIYRYSKGQFFDCHCRSSPATD